MESDSIWLVEFYAPWCGHCKNLAPEWEKAAKQLKGVVKIGAVDMTVHENVGRPYDVKGFPTIKFLGFNKKKPESYEGAREASAIVDFALNKAVKEVKGRKGGGGGSAGGSKSSSSGGGQKKAATDKDVIVLNDSNFDATVFGSKDIWLVEFYAPWCGHCKALEPEWNDAAAQLKGKLKMAKVDATENQGLAQRFGVQGYPTIKYFDYGLPKSVGSAKPYEGERTASGIVRFASDLLDKADISPDVYEIFEQSVYDKNCKGSTICAISFLPNIYESSAKDRNIFLKAHAAAAKKTRSLRLTHFWLQAGDQLDLERALNLGFGFPAMVVVSPAKQLFGTLRGQYSEKGLSEFLSKAGGGQIRNLEPLPKSGMQFKKVDKWDGKDAEPLVEEEYEYDEDDI